jgi:hypothetical protein
VWPIFGELGQVSAKKLAILWKRMWGYYNIWAILTNFRQKNGRFSLKRISGYF